MDDKPEHNQTSLWELGSEGPPRAERAPQPEEGLTHAEEIFAEEARGGLEQPPAAQVATRGTLNMSEVPLEMRYRRPEAHALHVRLERLLGVVDLILTDNRRRMLSSKRGRKRIEIRIHHMFMGCDAQTVGAIADLLGGVSSARKGARAIIQGYIRDNRDAISFEPTDDELHTRGEFFNLATVLDEVVEGLEPAMRADLRAIGDIHITWGRRSQGNRSIRFGSYDFDRKLIRIHPALDRDWVPRYFVAFIIYHELLHALFPPISGCASSVEGTDSSGTSKRRLVHTPEFNAMERRFPDYQKAMRWEAANLRKILDQK
ncbi:hypothetical protein [Bradymonas sediminis]|uniref:Uncharacterized protein n=1 Tax=Bradymonas sediminis TaxID=1548548 RepID=A0A2Z4FNL5_9DELT|nr:hypothetical protein [Bradymonas sediminis]AWV90569.1 hypothetical protein DN745_15030 [Bradymonas sediminis]TDP72034.1 hypothetical protein DFR33_10714 [Bradymonas sediminis]